MIRPGKYIALLLISLSTFTFAQKVEEIEINSSRVFSETEIKSWAGLNVGQNYFPGIIDTSLTRISTALSYNGYFNPSFEESGVEFSSDSQTVTIKLNIDEGEPTFIRDVIFSATDSSFLDYYNSAFNYLKGEIFNLYETENIISDILAELENLIRQNAGLPSSESTATLEIKE